MFFVGCGGERSKLFDLLQDTCGNAFGFQAGIALTAYHDVSSVLSEPQLKGQYLGAQPVPNECMGPNTLIFKSNGEAHKKMKEFLMKGIKVRRKKYFLIPLRLLIRLHRLISYTPFLLS